MSIRQPTLGILGLVISIAISLFIISLFSAATFGAWVTYFLVICLPVQVVMAFVLQAQYPAFIKNLKQTDCQSSCPWQAAQHMHITSVRRIPHFEDICFMGSLYYRTQALFQARAETYDSNRRSSPNRVAIHYGP